MGLWPPSTRREASSPTHPCVPKTPVDQSLPTGGESSSPVNPQKGWINRPSSPHAPTTDQAPMRRGLDRKEGAPMRRGLSLRNLLRLSSETLSGAGRRPRSASCQRRRSSRRGELPTVSGLLSVSAGLTASFPAAGRVTRQRRGPAASHFSDEGDRAGRLGRGRSRPGGSPGASAAPGNTRRLTAVRELG